VPTQHICPVCHQDDAVRCRDDPRFYLNGKLMGICFHGHSGKGPVRFEVETGNLISQAPAIQDFERLYLEATEDNARGFPGPFLAEYCGIYCLSREAIHRANLPFPNERDFLQAQKVGGIITVAPLYSRGHMSGIQCRTVMQGAAVEPKKRFQTLGVAGCYIANTLIQPQVVVVMEGVWDAVAAALDAFNAGEPHRYAWVGISANHSAQDLKQTLDSFFPGVPVLVITDQDSAGIAARRRFSAVGTLAILNGVGLAKDYRYARPNLRWPALLEAMELAINGAPPGQETGLAKVARRALEGAKRAMGSGEGVHQAWRTGQRCGGCCMANYHNKKIFSLRTLVAGKPVAEGQHEFSAVLGHSLMREIRQTYPDLAAIIEGGVTEVCWSPDWCPPQFLADGRHWTEIPESNRDLMAQENGWEPWQGCNPGPPEPTDLDVFVGMALGLFECSCTPVNPLVSPGHQVAVISLAMALSAFAAEESWRHKKSIGFLPGVWIYGGPGSGKGTVATIVAAATTGAMETYGNECFDGFPWAWLTESVLHCPVAYRDEIEVPFSAPERGDLKAFLAGEALHLRKKYAAGMSIYPRPVLFTANRMTLPNDPALLQRIIRWNLEPDLGLPVQKREDRFAEFYQWLKYDGGTNCIYRLGLALYRQFRTAKPSLSTRWTRSSIFDGAVAFIANRMGLNPDSIMIPLGTREIDPGLASTSWYQALQQTVVRFSAEVLHVELNLMEALGLTRSDSDLRKLRRWVEDIDNVARRGPFRLGEFQASLGPPVVTPERTIEFDHVYETPLNEYKPTGRN